MALYHDPAIDSVVNVYSATTGIKKYLKKYGMGWVGSKLYVNPGTVGLIADKAAHTALNTGTLATVTGLTAVEYGLGGFLHNTVFTLTGMGVTLADATVGAGTKIYDFPKGATLILTASGAVAETTTSILANTLNTGVTYNWGVGTTTQANGTLATTEQDIIPTTNGTASVTISVAGATSKATRTAAPAAFDGHATAKSAFFNVGIAGATDIDGDATTTWDGTISIVWMIDPTSV